MGEFDRGQAFEIRSAPKETPPTNELTTLGFSTYVGAGNDEEGIDIFVDSSNNVFVAGSTSSTSSSDAFPTVPGSYDTSGSGWDGFIFKMNPTGSGLIYSTFIGGSGTEFLADMKVDTAGNVYVTGRTNSSDFPFFAGFDATYNGGALDGFVTKLNPAGSALVFSTYLGGSSDDRAWGIAIDGSDNVYVSGFTFSSNFPVTATAFDMTANGSWDAFLTKFNSSGATLAYSTYFGGSGGEDGNVKVAVDSAGNAYIAGAGTSDSPSFPVTAGVIQPARAGSYDLYIAKIDTNVSGPSGLIYSTFLGGTGFENTGPGKIRVNAAGEAHLNGYTQSAGFPTTAGAYDTSHNGGEDAVVIKLNSTATGLLYSTFLGSGGNEQSSGLFITPTGEVFVTGFTTSPAFPVTSGAYDTTHGGSGDVFVAKVDVTGTLTGSASLMYSTFLGAGSEEAGFGIFATAAEVAYVTGYSRGADYPTTPGAFDTTWNGVNDVFVTRMQLAASSAQVSIGGRVLDENGYGVPGAIVTLTQANGTTLTYRTNSFGYYRFPEIPAGQTVVVSVLAKGRQYNSQFVLVNEDLTDLNFFPVSSG
ncbi:SBBP repeat-containing protein [Leptolyngbya sp. 7M]|uniref:SBBP repeat-containing protein n=1 Tax=Leptolyngbya sp. 7M TaxID=2812896 RepID=UPI001B8B014F|nr:SBBP repeat-containing protein [Leptolyngbya sp. 7M]QYO67180.1 SBBP repeat-containing protein [Leptolyngbya sp. 7M]